VRERSSALLEYHLFHIPTLQYDLLDSDCCALSLQPFTNPVAVITEPSPTNPTPRADVFELMNIVPYIRKFKTNPVTGEPLDTSQLIKLNFFKVSRFMSMWRWTIYADNEWRLVDRIRKAICTIQSLIKCSHHMFTSSFCEIPYVLAQSPLI